MGVSVTCGVVSVGVGVSWVGGDPDPSVNVGVVAVGVGVGLLLRAGGLDTCLCGAKVCMTVLVGVTVGRAVTVTVGRGVGVTITGLLTGTRFRTGVSPVCRIVNTTAKMTTAANPVNARIPAGTGCRRYSPSQSRHILMFADEHVEGVPNAAGLLDVQVSTVADREDPAAVTVGVAGFLNGDTFTIRVIELVVDDETAIGGTTRHGSPEVTR